MAEIQQIKKDVKRERADDIKEQKKFNAKRRKERVKGNFRNSIPVPSSFKSLGLLGLIFILLTMGVIFRLGSNAPNPSFEGLLEFLSNFGAFSINLSIPIINIGVFPDWIAWLFAFINAIVSILNFALWIVQSLTQILGLILSFIGWLIIF